MSTTELPDIPGFNTESDSRLTENHKPARAKSGYSLLSLLATGFVSVLLASIIALSLIIAGRDTILVLVGAASLEDQQEKLVIAVEEQAAQLRKLTASLEQYEGKTETVNNHIDATTFDVNKLTQRVTTIERFSADLERRIAESKKIHQAAVAQQNKKIDTTKPKPAPVVPVILVSIRNQAGTPLVSLKDGLDKSDLLMPGDSWRGWKFIDADLSTKTARFLVANKMQELRL